MSSSWSLLAIFISRSSSIIFFERPVERMKQVNIIWGKIKAYKIYFLFPMILTLLLILLIFYLDVTTDEPFTYAIF